MAGSWWLAADVLKLQATSLSPAESGFAGTRAGGLDVAQHTKRVSL